MKCSCPKCSASINIDEPDVPEKGSFSRCPDCSSRFWTHRETFMMRGYKKGWKVFCHHCGDEVGSANFCQSCYAPFPEYWVVQSSKPARRRTSYRPEFSFSLPSRTVKQESTVAEVSDFELPEKTKSSPKPILLVLAVLVVVVLAVSGMKYYNAHQQESLFSQNYIKTLYGVKSATEFNFKKLSQISSGKPLSKNEVNRLEEMKKRIDKSRLTLVAPPEKYVNTVADLDGFYSVYDDLLSLTLSTAGVTEEYREKLALIKSNVNQAEQRLKKNLPDDLRGDVKDATNKYRNLIFLVN